MIRKITFALMCASLVGVSLSCKKILYTKDPTLTIVSITPIDAETIQLDHKVEVVWNTTNLPASMKKVSFTIEGYVNDVLKITSVLEPQNISIPGGMVPFTNNDGKEIFTINLGPQHLYANVTYKVRGQVTNESLTNTAILAVTYWKNPFKIFLSGCISEMGYSTLTGQRCAITTPAP